MEIRRQAPVEFWIKLPLAPDELRRLGHDIPDPYPELESRWYEHNKQWIWALPNLEAVPDVASAVELTSRYQPPNGPMPIPPPNKEVIPAFVEATATTIATTVRGPAQVAGG